MVREENLTRSKHTRKGVTIWRQRVRIIFTKSEKPEKMCLRIFGFLLKDVQNLSRLE
tara:strand:+ start:1941 stop:2111 length:171 start_codon:yes stop_codon:yes gene_type:complete